MTAKMHISFDCEGRWGIADRGGSRQEVLTSENLRHAYEEILRILRKYDVAATFGFVTAFTMEKDELADSVFGLEGKLVFNEQDWLKPALTDISDNKFEGWSEPALLRLVADEDGHYICSHGGFHLPYDERKVPLSSAELDVEVAGRLSDKVKSPVRALIFPRNVIGYQAVLNEHGFVGYRGVDPCEQISGLRGKVSRLANEFLNFDARMLEGACEEVELTELSDAKFLNARIGIRRIVPERATRRRIDILVSSAIKNGGTLHFYTHPHNFINDSTMYSKLDYLCRKMRRAVADFGCSIVTIEDEVKNATRI